MIEYVKPDYEVMVFEANEYVAACPWLPNTELTIGCGEGKLDIKLGSKAFNFEKDGVASWYAQAYSTEDKTWSGSHMLFPIFEKIAGVEDKDPNVHTREEYRFSGNYGYQGNIIAHHEEDDQNGECFAWNGQNGSTYYLASSYSDGSGYTWNQSAEFHLLSFVRNKNLS